MVFLWPGTLTAYSLYLYRQVSYSSGCFMVYEGQHTFRFVYSVKFPVWMNEGIWPVSPHIFIPVKQEVTDNCTRIPEQLGELIKMKYK